MDNNYDFYDQIRRKLEEWIWYDDNEPKSNYCENQEEHDEFRSRHDRDCVLTGGNLKADTLFSLWTPLKQTILLLNDEETIAQVGNIRSKMSFVRDLAGKDNLEKLLPAEQRITAILNELFRKGMGRENVFLLPDRQLNVARARRPYCDYVPAMLYEAFEGGRFAGYWNGDGELADWIRQEKLEMLFAGDISRECIRDLAGNGDVTRWNPPQDLEAMERLVEAYSAVLQERAELNSAG